MFVNQKKIKSIVLSSPVIGAINAGSQTTVQMQFPTDWLTIIGYCVRQQKVFIEITDQSGQFLVAAFDAMATPSEGWKLNSALPPGNQSYTVKVTNYSASATEAFYLAFILAPTDNKPMQVKRQIQ